jgi:hypothetical protein
MQVVDPQELLTNGLIQELNRQFLHPRGYALQVNFNDDGTPNGDGQTSWLTVVVDTDPEGIAFADLSSPESKAKADEVYRMLTERTPARSTSLGWVVQPIGSILP